MKVILLEEVPGKGGEGDIVDVNRGFANNYLLRNGMAMLATKGNLKQLEQRRKNIAKREATRMADAEALRAKLEAKPIVVKARAGEEGQLFGSVTTTMISDAIADQVEVVIDRRRIDERKTIKTVGEHEVEISLYRDVKAIVKLSVVDEAAAAAVEAAAEPEPEPVEEAEVEAEAAAEEVAE